MKNFWEIEDEDSFTQQPLGEEWQKTTATVTISPFLLQYLPDATIRLMLKTNEEAENYEACKLIKSEGDRRNKLMKQKHPGAGRGVFFYYSSANKPSSSRSMALTYIW